MNLRTAMAAATCLGGAFFLGCNVPDAPVTPETSPLETTTNSETIDPAGRLFLNYGIQPAKAVEVHNIYVEEFIRRPGFGGGRRMPVEFFPTPQEWVELVSESQGDRRPLSQGAGKQPATYDAIAETLTQPDGTSRSVREKVWLIQERFLLGVLTEPVVYKIESKGQHDLMKAKAVKPAATGADTPKRALDKFETDALVKLRAGDESVLQSTDKEMRVLGAIRARQECLSCHKVEAGTLLGAFTYTMKLQSEATPEADRLKEKAGLSEQELGAVQVVESLGGKVIRTPGGPVTELKMTFARNRDIEDANKPNKLVPAFFSNPTTRVRLHDSALPVAGAFPELAKLDVSHSLVSDAGLKTIAELKHLKKLDLTDTVVTDAGVAALKKELPACEIVRPIVQPLPLPQAVPPSPPGR